MFKKFYKFVHVCHEYLLLLRRCIFCININNYNVFSILLTKQNSLGCIGCNMCVLILFKQDEINVRL